jgi:hypothetical protein
MPRGAAFMAAMSGAWLRRKVHHPWVGGPHLKARSCLIDGEAVASDENGLAVFELLRVAPSIAAGSARTGSSSRTRTPAVKREAEEEWAG